MSPRERAYACLLVLRYGWLGRVDVVSAAIYDTDNDRVAVEWKPADKSRAWASLSCAWATLIPGETAETVLDSIGAQFGADMRRRAEARIARAD